MFYLRLLLLNVPSPTSFDFLKTVDGILYHSFKEACQARGLLDNDSEHDSCLNEAFSFQNDFAFQRLFMLIVATCSPVDPLALLLRHKQQLEAGCRRRLENDYNIPDPSPAQIWDLALSDLERLAGQHGTSLADLGLPVPSQEFVPGDLAHGLIVEELAYDRDEQQRIFDQGMATANADQARAVNQVIHSVNNNLGQLFFLDGPGGTGKTFVEHLCLAKVRAMGKIALPVASSGVAALLLQGGRTAHFRFSIPVDVMEDSVCNVSYQSRQAELFRRTDLIIWDEAVMQNNLCFYAVNRMLQDVREAEGVLFGGITVLFAGEFALRLVHAIDSAGDLRQCLPVLPLATRGEQIAATISRSSFWPSVVTLPLTINMRLQNSDDSLTKQYGDWLLALGEGRLAPEQHGVQLSPTVQVFTDSGTGCGLDVWQQCVFDGVTELDVSDASLENDMDDCARYFSDRVILAPYNRTINELNAAMLDVLQGDTVSLLSADKAFHQDDTEYDLPVEFLNHIELAGFPPHELRLKRGCPVILLRNIDPSNGLCNGTRLIVLSIRRNVLRCRVISGSGTDREVFIPRIKLDEKPAARMPFTLRRIQFPIKLAFAMTINKAQGQSLQHVAIDLSTRVFSHGQLYVALSRAKDIHSITVRLPEGSRRQTPNIVYHDVFNPDPE